MSNPRPLSDGEKVRLKRLLAQNDAYEEFVRNSPTAAEIRQSRAAAEVAERAAAEAAKRAEEEAIAEENRIAAALAALSSVCDECRATIRAWQRGHPGYDYHDGGRALRYVTLCEASFQEKLPTPAMQILKPESVVTGIRLIMQCEYPKIFPPTPTEERAEEAKAAALERSRAETAQAIVNAGAARRGEPPPVINIKDYKK